MGKRDSLKAEMARAATGRLGTQSGWEDKLLGTLSQDLQGTQGSFCRGLEKIARRAIATGGTVDPVNDVLTTLRLLVLSVAAGSAEMRGGVEDMFQEARPMLTNVGLAAYRERDQAASNHMRRISETCFSAISTGEIGPLSQALTDHLPQLGVAACTISRITPSQRRGSELDVVARLSAELGTSRRAHLPLGSLGADQSLEHRAAVLVLPLNFGGEALGVATFAWGAHNPVVYEQLREPLGIALYASRERTAARASTGT
jgi:hypothetical protein